MRLLFVADGVSPIARNWIQHFVESEHETHLVSTRPCDTITELDSLSVVPVAFSGVGYGSGSRSDRKSPLTASWTIGLRSTIRHWLGPLTVGRAALHLRELVERLRPDLIHAMRIPFEGAMAAAAGVSVPLIISVWGNDFTLHAPATPGMGALTRKTLASASGLHTDCQRDQRLADEFGMRASSARLVMPGNGGVRADIFYPGPPGEAADPELQSALLTTSLEHPVIVNPRGFRGYVRNDVFFQAIPMVLERFPDAVFFCVGMQGDRRAERWLERLGIDQSVRLLPALSPVDMGVVFRRSAIMVSPSLHDGTPNTLIESMACGSFPVAGALESIEEWIEDGKNGALIDPRQPESLAQAVVRAVSDEAGRQRAALANARIVAERAEYQSGMARAEDFYRSLLDAS